MRVHASDGLLWASVQVQEDGTSVGAGALGRWPVLAAVRRWRLPIVLTVLVIPVIQLSCLSWLIWERTSDVPYGDEWRDTLIVAHKFASGTLRPSDLWAFHNEHRVLTLRVVDLTIIQLTQYNRQIEMTFDLIVGIGSVLLFLACIRRTLSMGQMVSLIVPVSLLLFSINQVDNWFWPDGLAVLATVFGVALCMWAFTVLRPSPRGLCIAVLGALIASWSVAGGLAVWLAFAPNLWYAGYRRGRYLLIWGMTGLVTTIIYVHGMPRSSHGVTRPFEAIQFALAYLGAPVGFPDAHLSQFATLCGGIVLLANVYAYWFLIRNVTPLIPWVGPLVFALACAGLTAIARTAQFGIGQALAQRYEAFSSLWWIVVAVVTVASTIELARYWRRARTPWLSAGHLLLLSVNVASLLVMCALLVQVNRAGFAFAREWQSPMRESERCILNYEVASDQCLKAYLPIPPSDIRTFAPYLEENHWGIFRTGHPLHVAALRQVAESAGYASIDAVGGSAVSPVHAPLRFVQQTNVNVAGWAVDGDAGTTADGVLVSIDGTRNILATYGAARPDIAQQFANPGYRESGFSLAIETDILPVGPHTLTLKVLIHGSTSYFSPPQSIPFEIVSATNLVRGPEAVNGYYNIEAINGIVASQAPITVARDARLTVSGWALDSSVGAVAGGIYLCIDDDRCTIGQYGFDRPDVATALQNPAFRDCGFIVITPIADLAPGIHRLTLRVITADSTTFLLTPQPFLINVT